MVYLAPPALPSSDEAPPPWKVDGASTGERPVAAASAATERSHVGADYLMLTAITDDCDVRKFVLAGTKAKNR